MWKQVVQGVCHDFVVAWCPNVNCWSFRLTLLATYPLFSFACFDLLNKAAQSTPFHFLTGSIGSEDQSQGGFAKSVKLQHSVAFAKLKTMKPSSKRQVPSLVPAEVMECKLCAVKKHACAWCYVSEGKLRKTKGGSCYSCYQATRLLKCSRSVELLLRAGLRTAVVEVSARVRNSLGKQDKCRCNKCEGAASNS